MNPLHQIATSNGYAVYSFQKGIFWQFEIIPWLEKFIDEFESRYNLTSGDIKLDQSNENILVRIDPSQLHQVIWNLCENAMRYSQDKPLITITSNINQESQCTV